MLTVKIHLTERRSDRTDVRSTRVRILNLPSCLAELPTMFATATAAVPSCAGRIGESRRLLLRSFIYAQHLPSSSVAVLQISRTFSSSNGRGGNRKGGSFKLDALTFKVSPDEALSAFNKWATEDQGLRYLLNWKNVKITAAYTPVWSFDVNVRFGTRSEGSGRKRYDLKPEPFTVYKTDTVHVPGLSAYSGYEYRRSLINPVHNTTLTFMGDKTQPFGSWMLREMKSRSGMTLPIYPDPWNATRARAFAVVVEELESLAEDDYDRIGDCEVQTEMVSARRVYMPTYVIDYTILGGEYRAFLSGCDAGSGVSGVSHRALPFSGEDITDASNSFMSGMQSIARVSRGIGPAPLMLALNFVINVASRLLARIPIVSVLGAGFVAFKKIAKPWYDNRIAGAEWERQRENEKYMADHDDHIDDFYDASGKARSYFQRNRIAILRYLSGEQEHDEGNYNWYQKWEEWAREQYEKQRQAAEEAQRAYERASGTEYQRQRQQQETYRRQQQQQQWQRERARTTGGARQQQAKKKTEYQWDFNPEDPYSVLGLKRGATKSEVSQAFRREMLKYHPDTQVNATDAEKDRALERSKLITEAYRKIKAQMK